MWIWVILDHRSHLTLKTARLSGLLTKSITFQVATGSGLPVLCVSHWKHGQHIAHRTVTATNMCTFHWDLLK